MIITKDLVILNLPKTGSSFVRKVIKDIYWKRNKNILTRALLRFGLIKILHRLGYRAIGYKELRTKHPTVSNYKDQHGCYDQIPTRAKNKKILSVVRDPYLRLISIYKFKWWAKNPPLENELIKSHFPNFPDLTFQQYLKLDMLTNKRMKEKYGIDKHIKIGNQSIQFIRFFFRNHKKILAELNTDYIVNGSYKNDICDVTLIKNENLNEELASFLSKFDFSNEELSFIRDHGKVNVTKNNVDNSFLNQEFINYINENEWILLEILSFLGFKYKKEPV